MKETMSDDTYPIKQAKPIMRLNIKHQNMTHMLASKENLTKPSPETEATTKTERRRRAS